MFVSDRIVFIELHKTGGTHIGQWLQALVGGQQVGKHNRVPPHLQNRFLIGSIRNPWDWYVSLWAYGCAGKGSVRHQSTRRIDLHYYYDELPHEMGKHLLSPSELLLQITADMRKPVKAWTASYRRSSDPAAFREWLKLLLDSKRSLDIGEGYGFSPISINFGLLTYRYIKLFTKLDQHLYREKSIASEDGLHQAWVQSRLVNFLIRNENLEEDFIEALSLAGYKLTEDQKQSLKAGKKNKINTSERKPSEYYYDQETLELVNLKEKFIITEHQYSPPQIPSNKS